MKVVSVIIVMLSVFWWMLWGYIFQTSNIYKDDNVEKNNVVQTNKSINITNLENEIIDNVKKISPSVANIVIKKDLTIYRNDPWGFFQTPVWTIKRKVWGWTWFFVTKDWILITNKHVISDKNAEYTVITNDNQEYNAKVLAIDPITDLAVIKIYSENEFTPLSFIKNIDSEIQIWQFAIAIWNALAEFQNSVSLWVISWKNRTIEAWWDKLSWLLQTDAAINPWNSWWPLINLDWKVIWINTAIVDGSQWIGFSIPLSDKKINFILDSIEKFWEIKKPFIGISYTPITNNIKEQLWVNVDYWAYINKEKWSILQWSAADKAWLKPWDIILEIDNIKVTTTNDLRSLIQNKIPTDTINLKVLQNWKIKNIKIILGMD